MTAIRAATTADRSAIWSILEPVLRSGDTYALPSDISEIAAIAYWCGPDHETFVLEEKVEILGTYFLRANQLGGGDHVANCGYITSTKARGRGIARRMLEHSLTTAAARGFRAMQFNFVVSSNDRAVAIWKAYGFDIVGRLPLAFRHPTIGLIDAYVMHRNL